MAGSFDNWSDWQIVGHSSPNDQTSPHTVPNNLFQPIPGVSQGYHSCPVFRNLPKSRVALVQADIQIAQPAA
jgi:hypothetical protein